MFNNELNVIRYGLNILYYVISLYTLKSGRITVRVIETRRVESREKIQCEDHLFTNKREKASI